MPNKKINELTPRTPTLTDLLIVGDPASGYSYKATISTISTFVGNNIQFSSLGGISLSSPTNGQVLTYNGTNWVNQTPAAAPVTSVFGRTGVVVAAEGDYSLTLLSDVTLSSPTTNQVLQYNGTAWVNATFVAGINSLNGLTATTQTFATGTSGTDFTISSTTSTHTFNLPTASATNTGKLSSTDWSTFNAKQNAITLTTTGSSGASTLVGATLNIPTYTLAGLGGVSGSGTTNYVSKWTSSTALGNSQIFDNGTSVGIATASPLAAFTLDNNGAFHNYGQAAFLMNTGDAGGGNAAIGVGILPASVSRVSGERVLQITSYYSTIRLVANSNNNTLVIHSGVPSGQYIGTSTASDFAFRTNNTEKMRLTSAGRLLIGTTTESTYELDVVGDIRSTLDANINGLTVGKGGGNILTNTAVGYEAILNSTTGAINNTAQGYQALRTNTTGNNNSALGYVALYTNSVGIRNTAVGSFALQGLNSDNNTGVGFQNLLDVTSGQGNTAIGSNTGRGITTGSYNTIIGASVTGLSSSLSNTIILADGQGNQRLVINPTLGIINLGFNAGISFTSGGGINIGNDAGRRQTTATENTIIGTNAGAYLTTNNSNTLIGFYAGNVVSGAGNTYLGWYAGVSAGASNYNTGIGTGSLQNITTGSNNTAIGYRAGRFYGAATSGNTTGANGIFIGYQSRASADGNTNETVIGYDALGNGSNSVTLGNTSVTKTVLQSGVLVGTTTSAGYALDVNGTFRGAADGRFDGSDSRTLTVAGTTYQKATLIRPGSILCSDGSVFSTYVTLESLGNTGRMNFAQTFDFRSGSTYSYNTLLSLDASGTFTFNSLKADINYFFKTDNSDNTLYIDGGNDNVGVGTATPNASALLDITSTTKGFLPPRMTGAQAEAIATPAAGLMVYANNGNGTTITSTGWWGYDGSAWVKLN